MDRVVIYDEANEIVLPKCRFSIGGECVYTESTMAGGRRVRDIQGFRPKIILAWEYFPAEELSKLCTLLRKGGFFKVRYPDQDGSEREGYFSADYPTTEVFEFVNGEPVFYGVKLNLTAQEVL